MSDVNLALTGLGEALKAKIETGTGIPLRITRIVSGSGTSNDLLHLTAVTHEEQEFTIISSTTMGARTMITAMVTNTELNAGYQLSQIGIYAADPDQGEILYRISQFVVPHYVPPLSERGWTYQPTFNIITGNATEVIVNIDPAGIASKEDLQAVEDELNAHIVDPMPHRFRDGTTMYRYGLAVIGGVVNMVYEEVV